MSVEGEPTLPKLTKFKATVGTDHEGNPLLVFEAPINDESSTAYIIKGQDLFNFYAMLKRAMEGDGKRPTYLS